MEKHPKTPDEPQSTPPKKEREASFWQKILQKKEPKPVEAPPQKERVEAKEQLPSRPRTTAERLGQAVSKLLRREGRAESVEQPARAVGQEQPENKTEVPAPKTEVEVQLVQPEKQQLAEKLRQVGENTLQRVRQALNAAEQASDAQTAQTQHEEIIPLQQVEDELEDALDALEQSIEPVSSYTEQALLGEQKFAPHEQFLSAPNIREARVEPSVAAGQPASANADFDGSGGDIVAERLKPINPTAKIMVGAAATLGTLEVIDLARIRRLRRRQRRLQRQQRKTDKIFRDQQQEFDNQKSELKAAKKEQKKMAEQVAVNTTVLERRRNAQEITRYASGVAVETRGVARQITQERAATSVATAARSPIIAGNPNYLQQHGEFTVVQSNLKRAPETAAAFVAQSVLGSLETGTARPFSPEQPRHVSAEAAQPLIGRTETIEQIEQTPGQARSVRGDKGGALVGSNAHFATSSQNNDLQNSTSAHSATPGDLSSLQKNDQSAWLYGLLLFAAVIGLIALAAITAS